jgi:hypothetical protein
MTPPLARTTAGKVEGAWEDGIESPIDWAALPEGVAHGDDCLNLTSGVVLDPRWIFHVT